jgi:hypothetical protein
MSNITRAKISAGMRGNKNGASDYVPDPVRVVAKKAKQKSRAREYYQRPEVKARLAAYQRTWRSTHVEQVEKQRRSRYQELRRLVLEAYGGRCVCCGETHPHFLSIDHKNGGGKFDRIAHGCREGGVNWYRYLLNEHPAHVQILCHNCNMAKGHYGICPHQSQREQSKETSWMSLNTATANG